MGLISFTPITDGSTSAASQVNTPLTTIYNDYNGGITSANLATGAVATSNIAGSAVDYTKVAAGAVVQVVNALYSSVATGTTVIPLDNTIPQNTEGDQYMSLAITPKATTHVLIIDATIYLAHSASTTNLSAALFQDSTAGALAGANTRIETAGHGIQLRVLHTMAAGTTSATTFKIRAGSGQAGTTTFNGSAGASEYGAITKSSIVIHEYKA